VASRLGAKHIVDSRHEALLEQVLRLTDGDGADLVVDAVGSALSKKQSLAATRPGGTTVWIGLHETVVTIDSHEVTLAEKRVQGSYAAAQDELKIAVDLLASGRIDGTSWIKKFPLV